MNKTLLNPSEAAFERYMAALLEGDTRKMLTVIEQRLKANLPIIRIYTDFVQKGLYEIGRLWEREEIGVSTEHLASSATHVIVSELFLRQRAPHSQARQAVIACVPNELHEVGVLVIANVFEMFGWKASVLGANTPLEDMMDYIAQRKRFPDLLALSVTLCQSRPYLADHLKGITTRFPELSILIGGQALAGDGEGKRLRESCEARYPTVRYLGSLDELQEYLRTFGNDCRTINYQPLEGRRDERQ